MDFSRIDLPRQINNIDHRNLYSIKRMITSLISEFNNAIENEDKNSAKRFLELTKQLGLKIQEPNPFWAGKLNKVIQTMNIRVSK